VDQRRHPLNRHLWPPARTYHRPRGRQYLADARVDDADKTMKINACQSLTDIV